MTFWGTPWDLAKMVLLDAWRRLSRRTGGS